MPPSSSNSFQQRPCPAQEDAPTTSAPTTSPPRDDAACDVMEVTSSVDVSEDQRVQTSPGHQGHALVVVAALQTVLTSLLSYVSFTLTALGVVMVACVMNAIWCVPPVRRKVFRQMAIDSGLKGDMDDQEADEFGESAGNLAFVIALITQKWRETRTGVISNGALAYNSVLHHMNDVDSKCHLLDFVRPGRPLVVNFGSCT